MVVSGCAKVPLDKQPFSLVFRAVCIYLRDSLLGDNRRYFCVGCQRQTGTVPPCFLALIGVGWNAAGTDELYTASRFTLFYLGLPAERTLVLLIFVFTPVVDSNVRQCEVRKRKKKCSLMGERILGVTMSRLPLHTLRLTLTQLLLIQGFEKEASNMGPAVYVTFRSLWGKKCRNTFLT